MNTLSEPKEVLIGSMSDTSGFDISICGRVLRINPYDEDGALKRIVLSLVDKEELKGKGALFVLIKRFLEDPNEKNFVPKWIKGTKFQLLVWEITCQIPFGRTITYGELARSLGRASPRAVGQALSKNPLPIIIPCHRVIGRHGRLAGFSAGVKIKALLLENEAQVMKKQ